MTSSLAVAATQSASAAIAAQMGCVARGLWTDNQLPLQCLRCSAVFWTRSQCIMNHAQRSSELCHRCACADRPTVPLWPSDLEPPSFTRASSAIQWYCRRRGHTLVRTVRDAMRVHFACPSCK